MPDGNIALVLSFLSVVATKRKHLVLSNHGDEHGERDVSDIYSFVQ